MSNDEHPTVRTFRSFEASLELFKELALDGDLNELEAAKLLEVTEAFVALYDSYLERRAQESEIPVATPEEEIEAAKERVRGHLREALFSSSDPILQEIAYRNRDKDPIH